MMLSNGDSENDVAMNQEANIGCEGSQAATSAAYAFGQSYSFTDAGPACGFQLCIQNSFTK